MAGRRWNLLSSTFLRPLSLSFSNLFKFSGWNGSRSNDCYKIKLGDRLKGKWSTDLHSRYSKEFKSIVKILLTLRNKKSAGAFYKIPKPILFIIFRFVSLSEV